MVFAAFAGVAIIAAADRLPAWSIQICIAIGSLAIARAIYHSHEPNAYYSIFYLWVALYSFYFFGRFWGLVQLGIAAGAYGWVLTQVPADSPLSLWVVTMVSLAVAGLLVDVLARELREREAESAGRARALAAVDTVAHELALRTNVESAAPAICDAASEVARAAGASLWQPTSDGGGLEATAATDPELVGKVVLLMGQPRGRSGPSTPASRSSSARRTGAPRSTRRLVEQFERRLGPVSADHARREPDRRTCHLLGRAGPGTGPEVEQVMSLLAAEASIAIERTKLLARLEQAARTDDLTGLPNRRAWDEHLARELARAKRVGTSLCVAMLDLDHFKEYNDRHGHQGGDRFLKEAAAAWQTRIRETDLIARYGGEEFAIALLDCELARGDRDARPGAAGNAGGGELIRRRSCLGRRGGRGRAGRPGGRGAVRGKARRARPGSRRLARQSSKLRRRPFDKPSFRPVHTEFAAPHEQAHFAIIAGHGVCVR